MVFIFRSSILFFSEFSWSFLMSSLSCSPLWLHLPRVVKVHFSMTGSLKAGLLEKDLAACKTPWKPPTSQCLKQSILGSLRDWPAALWPCQGIGCTSSSKNTELTNQPWSQSSATSYCYCILPKSHKLKPLSPRSGSSSWRLAICYPKSVHFTQ